LTILLPMDGSAWSRKAMAYALDFARRHRARVVALHVLAPPPLSTPAEAGQAADHPARASSEETGQQVLQEAVEAAGRTGVALETCLIVGDPSEEIVRLAKELPADLIVMGAKGMGDQAENDGLSATRGSVATGVVRRARRPVLVMS
jgi:nucleotide-binding universal stress UspA family protein